MDLRQLEILRAVAETGSFTGAGQQLHLSQSAVSRQILLLEEELKEQLFLRLGRKIRITPDRDDASRLSQRVFDDLEQTRASIVDSQQRVTGTLRLRRRDDGVPLRVSAAAEGVPQASIRTST